VPFLDLSDWPLWLNVAVFLGGAIVIGWSGTRLAELGDRIADRTGLGEAVTGAVLLGFITALPGLAASVTAALEGHAALAISNAVGGIAIQTVFLAAADVVHRKANLEHAAASVTNMIQTIILVILLGTALLGISGPDVTVGHIHPVTFLLFFFAGAGGWLVYHSGEHPMWKPRETSLTIEDKPDASNVGANLKWLVISVIFHAILVTIAGVLVGHTTGNISTTVGMSETLAGGLLSGVATSLPELVTTIAAVRRGALTLAVSDIVGGNFFDVLFLFAADLLFFSGSLYHAAGVGYREVFLTALALFLNAILLLGLLFRQRTGPANIGFESITMIVAYLGGYAVLSLLM
jgi:cation:H+ antiporter